jgi:hypothetical protein
MRVALLALLVGCGGNAWTDADTKASTTILRTQRALVRLCQSDAGCTSAQVVELQNATECNLGSMLARHGADILDGGGQLGCQPQ